MKRSIAIYLAGSIQKGHEDSGDSFWTQADMDQLRTDLKEFEVIFLNRSS